MHSKMYMETCNHRYDPSEIFTTIVHYTLSVTMNYFLYYSQILKENIYIELSSLLIFFITASMFGFQLTAIFYYKFYGPRSVWIVSRNHQLNYSVTKYSILCCCCIDRIGVSNRVKPLNESEEHVSEDNVTL